MTDLEDGETNHSGRIVQESEIHDLMADVEGAIRNLNEPFVRVDIEPVSSEQWSANQKLAKAVSQTNECLNCGKSLDEGGFCGFECLQEWGDSS